MYTFAHFGIHRYNNLLNSRNRITLRLQCTHEKFFAWLKKTIIHSKQPAALTSIKETIRSVMYNVDSGQ